MRARMPTTLPTYGTRTDCPSAGVRERLGELVVAPSRRPPPPARSCRGRASSSGAWPGPRRRCPAPRRCPESRLPSMTVEAPQARARKTSLSFRTPPSAMIGTFPSVASQASRIACSCGTPAPVSSRVRQPRPGPTPTLIASAPRSARKRAPSAVATLPDDERDAREALRGTPGRRVATTSESAWATSIRTHVDLLRRRAPRRARGSRRSRRSPRRRGGGRGRPSTE